MSINHIDFGVMATSTDVTSIRAAEEARPVADQQNFQAQFREEVQNKEHSVNAKNDIDQGRMNADAQDKGSNEYMGDGGKNRRGKTGITRLKDSSPLNRWRRWQAIFLTETESLLIFVSHPVLI